MHDYVSTSQAMQICKTLLKIDSRGINSTVVLVYFTYPKIVFTMSGLYALGSLVPKTPSSVWIAPNASVIGNVILEEDVSVWFGVVIRGDIADQPIHIGARSNIQESAVLHHDANYPLTIGKDVTVGHKAMLHGCSIGDNTLIGMNATVLNGAKIGKNCLIGANTLISERKVIPDNSLVVGSPGKIVRKLTEEQAQALEASAAFYVKNGKKFSKQLCPVAPSPARSKL